MISDKIEQKVLLKLPRQRVWEALTREKEFAQWFGVEFVDGKFEVNKPAKLRSTHQQYRHIQFHITVEKMEPPSLFSWRWVPGAEQPEGESTTLVEFRLEETKDGGTMLTVTESGFDRLSLTYRAKAFQDNSHGWEEQAKSIQKYLEAAA